MTTEFQGLLTDAPQVNAFELMLSKDAAEALHTAYPGHLWGVAASERDGMLDVRNLYLSGNWGFRLKIPTMYSASEFKKRVVRAGGELLERFRVSRGRVRADEINSLHTDFAKRKEFDRD
jgi:hypothetical protein